MSAPWEPPPTLTWLTDTEAALVRRLSAESRKVARFCEPKLDIWDAEETP